MEEVRVIAPRLPSQPPGGVPRWEREPRPGNQNPDDRRGTNAPITKPDKTMPVKSPGPHNPKGPLTPPEIKVTAKDLSRYKTMALHNRHGRIGALLNAAHLMQDLWNRMSKLEREREMAAIIQSDADKSEEIQSVIEEVIVYGNTAANLENPDYRNSVFRRGMFGFGPQIREVAQQRYIESLVEHVHVTAPRVTPAGNVLREMEWDWEYIRNNTYQPLNIRVPYEDPHPYVDQRPVGDPYKDTEPMVDPFAKILDPTVVPRIQGKFEIKITPRGLRLNTRVGRRLSRRRREDNKRRRDTKESGASSRYRALLRVINKTFGKATEAMDLYEAISWNLYVDNKLLALHSDPQSALLGAMRTGRWHLDWENFMTDLFVMEMNDRMIGKASMAQREALNGMGYYGPNAGSYMPNWGNSPIDRYNLGMRF